MRYLSPSLALGAVLTASLLGGLLDAQGQQQPGSSASQAAPQTLHAGHEANPQHQAKMLAKKLGLTAEQRSKLEPILADRQQQVESAKADTTLPPKDKRAKVRDIRQAADASIEAVLNDTQKQQYEQMKQAHEANKKARGGAPANS